MSRRFHFVISVQKTSQALNCLCGYDRAGAHRSFLLISVLEAWLRESCSGLGHEAHDQYRHFREWVPVGASFALLRVGWSISVGNGLCADAEGVVCFASNASGACLVCRFYG